MAVILNSRPAPGGPGIAPRWTRGAKDAVGTAYSVAASIWFTIAAGIVTEVYYPTIDRPQIRDLQFLVTDGRSFMSDERSMEHSVEYLAPDALGVRMLNRDRQQHFQLVKEVIVDPHLECLLVRVRLEGSPQILPRLRLFVLLAPHLEVGGWGNQGNVVLASGRRILTAHKGNTWLGLDNTNGFVAQSCGYVGTTDGWQQLSRYFELHDQFDSVGGGNIALCGEIDLRQRHEFTLALAFGDSLHRTLTTLFQALGVPFEDNRERFIVQWKRTTSALVELAEISGDGGKLYRASHSLLLAHEDKTYPGALIASLSIPWGETRGDEDLGGYHLVWTRDMVNSATGLIAAGNTTLALRALIYLACSQLPDGSFYQNFWINGQPYWHGIQLDEVAFPILLAFRLAEQNALKDFDPLPMVLRAARFLVLNGPATAQERWEENSGYSPSTLAAVIAALICGAHFCRKRLGHPRGLFLLRYAEFLESHLEDWTVTSQGELHPDIKRHFIRLLPIDLNNPTAPEDPDHAIIQIKNRPPGSVDRFPARAVVDAGFLELVRHGIRRPSDPLIEDSLRVVDHCLKADLPQGPAWRRYNHDGYGQRDDGRAFDGWGVGRPWPLLTGERGHYELAAGRDPRPYLQAMERFASVTGLLPEQVWDRDDIPAALMFRGRPTGAAMPLMWAHAEYIKLLRSSRDGHNFDLIPEVAEHFRGHRRSEALEIWKLNRQPAKIAPGRTLRIVTEQPFLLHWSLDDWATQTDTLSIPSAIDLSYIDIKLPPEQSAPLRFTFYWKDERRWQGQDYQVAMKRD
ncbi:MAG TPA: glycoside hydrolase family 15 protein [Candidatus Binataceae bacterium]|nr:glycoside hydrolase family 15 protein [Candidatus Binataceae bacterium]